MSRYAQGLGSGAGGQGSNVMAGKSYVRSSWRQLCERSNHQPEMMTGYYLLISFFFSSWTNYPLL